ncbi:unnamed protein product, partial [Globisporangium polare]
LFCKNTGVARQVSEARNQASNGKAERMHRTILNMARCMIFACGLPLYFWGDAVEYAAFILNRSPTRANEKRASPFEVLTKQVPDVSKIVAFGSVCTVYRDPRKNSLKQRAQVGLIVGKSNETKGFRVFMQKDNVVIVTQHVKNIETLTDAQNSHLQRCLDMDEREAVEDVAKASSSEGETERAAAPAQDSVARATKKKSWARARHETRSMSKRPAAAETQKEPARELLNHVFDRDPKNYAEAMKSLNAAGWITAMTEEIEALIRLGVFSVIKRPSGSNVLHSKWVFKTKTDSQGLLERLKARLVACGNEQVFGVDYLLTFAAVMDMCTVKVLLALAILWGMPAEHGDVPNAYAKADKENDLEILLHIPRGMAFTAHELLALGVSSANELVLRLKKSLYGLKQAGRLWSQLLHAKLTEAGFERCITDMCLYFRRDGDDVVVVGVYVDDLLVTATRRDLVRQFFASMATLSIKNLGPVSKFLGMRVERAEGGGYSLDQEEAIDELLREHGLQDANSVRSPIGDDCYEVPPAVAELLQAKAADGMPTIKSFQSLVGSLLWIARCTRPEVAFAVHKATRQTHQPRLQDWKLAKRIARYLKGTKGLKLRMDAMASGREPLTLESYSDADYAADKADRKSLTGGVVLMNGMPVSWICKKQGGVSLSTMEAEFVAASETGRELLGIREMLMEVGAVVVTPMPMGVDNQAAIKQIEGEASSTKAKHIDVRVKFLCDYAKRGVVKPYYVRSELMLADLLTKALAAPKLADLRALVHLK